MSKPASRATAALPVPPVLRSAKLRRPAGARRGKTAFVFAGGSLGSVQVGMLRALMAHGAKADMIVGSSVGALNGAYFAGAPNAEGVQRLEQANEALARLRAGEVTGAIVLVP